MSTAKPRHLLRLEYEKAAEAYLRSLPPEHFMEATPQATQRKITIESMDIVQVRRPEVQTFNELLVQYSLPNRRKAQQVVPDNMVVVWPEPIQAVGSYDVPLQPTPPFWVLEYVSKHSERKDYEGSFQKYERELRVPFYLIFYPDVQELTLYQLKRGKYVSVKPNAVGRHAIAKLEMEVGLLDGWARFWFRGDLMPLSAELQHTVDDLKRCLAEANQQTAEANRQAQAEKNRADEEARRADRADQRADRAEQEIARLRAQLEQFGTRSSS